MDINYFVEETIKEFVERGIPFKLSEIREKNNGTVCFNQLFSDVDILNSYIKRGKLRFEHDKEYNKEGTYIPL